MMWLAGAILIALLLIAFRRPRLVPSGLASFFEVIVVFVRDEIVLATASGMAIRFAESDVRPMGRNASGVKGIAVSGDDHVVGMVVADPEAQLLTACANGYGKRTPFGPNLEEELPAEELDDEGPEVEAEEIENGNSYSSQRCYRAQRRGGKGLRDIRTTPRNGPVIGIVRISDDDELMMITARGKIQRVPAADISIVGRNTQGVRIMNLDPGDTLVAVKRVPQENNNGGEREPAPTP